MWVEQTKKKELGRVVLRDAVPRVLDSKDL